MEMLTLIIAMSAIMWYLVDRFKPMWSKLSFGKYITIAVSALFAFGLTFAFGLDLVFACGLFAEMTVVGQILTALVLMSGSSAVAEIIERIKGTNTQG